MPSTIPGSKPYLSIIIPTGRASYGSLVGLDEHLFLPTLRSLEKQTCKDFELVISDACHKHRDLASEISKLGEWSFRWRVALPQSFWLDQGMAAIQATINEACICADGIALMVSGDACEYPHDMVEKMIARFKQDQHPHLLSIYKRGGEVLRVDGTNEESVLSLGSSSMTLREWRRRGTFDKIARDSRWPTVESVDPFLTAPWSWNHNHAGMFMDDFFSINGFDEQLDGSKSLQDLDVGSSLEMAGRWTPFFSRDLFVYDHDHTGWDRKTFYSENGAPRSNFVMINIKRARGFLPNRYRLTAKEVLAILEEGSKSMEDRVPIYPNESKERWLQAEWIKRQRTFDVYKLWKDRHP